LQSARNHPIRLSKLAEARISLEVDLLPDDLCTAEDTLFEEFSPQKSTEPAMLEYHPNPMYLPAMLRATCDPDNQE
jgi:hypothetical protein